MSPKSGRKAMLHKILMFSGSVMWIGGFSWCAYSAWTGMPGNGWTTLAFCCGSTGLAISTEGFSRVLFGQSSSSDPGFSKEMEVPQPVDEKIFSRMTSIAYGPEAQTEIQESDGAISGPLHPDEILKLCHTCQVSLTNFSKIQAHFKENYDDVNCPESFSDFCIFCKNKLINCARVLGSLNGELDKTVLLKVRARLGEEFKDYLNTIKLNDSVYNGVRDVLRNCRRQDVAANEARDLSDKVHLVSDADQLCKSAVEIYNAVALSLKAYEDYDEAMNVGFQVVAAIEADVEAEKLANQQDQ